MECCPFRGLCLDTFGAILYTDMRRFETAAIGFRGRDDGMDTPTALSCYVQTAIKEREEYLYQAALKKARSLTRNMTAKETEDYLQSPAFFLR